MMPKQAVTSFRPPSNQTQTVFVTVLYYDGEGNGRYLAQNAPFDERKSLIVTATGGIVDAKDRNMPWVDLNGENHKKEMCMLCKEIATVCSFCLAESRMTEMQKSIGIVLKCQLSKGLIQMIAKVKQNQIAQKQQEVRDMVDEIENLAKMYWHLEARTKKAVGKVKVYGTSVKEAAEDYKNDADIDEFWRELTDMEDAKNSLMLAHEKHEEIKSVASLIQEEAKYKANHFGEKASIAAKYDDDEDGMLKSIMSIPVYGQVISGTAGIALGGLKALKFCEESESTNNIPVKVVATIAGASVTGAAFTVASIYAIPFAPYFWYKSIASNIDAKNFGALQEAFARIALQMGLVEDHLITIITCLQEIDTNLEMTQRAERKVINTLDAKKRQIMVDRLIARADDLVEATNNYFQIVNKNQAGDAITA